MNVLVTGAGGFIGHHLVLDQLSRGRSVTAVDLDLGRLEDKAGEKCLTLVQADFRDSSLDRILPQHQVCFHLASMHLEVGAADEEFFDVNVEGAGKLVERCHNAGVARFVHCSSVGVYGDIEGPPADEGSDCHPDLAYERSKLAGELRVREFSQRAGCATVIIRPSWVYGVGCPRTLKLARSIAKGRFFYVGDGNNLRHPIHIDDMLAGFELAAAHPDAPKGELFVMAGPEVVTTRRLVELIARRLGVRPPWLRIPEYLVWAGAFAVESAFAVIGREPPYSRRSLKFFKGQSAFNTGKANRLLGFEPRVPVVEGIDQTIGQLQQKGAL